MSESKPIFRVTAKDPANQWLADVYSRCLGRFVTEYALDNLFVIDPPPIEEWWDAKIRERNTGK